MENCILLCHHVTIKGYLFLIVIFVSLVITAILTYVGKENYEGRILGAMLLMMIPATMILIGTHPLEAFALAFMWASTLFFGWVIGFLVRANRNGHR